MVRQTTHDKQSGQVRSGQYFLCAHSERTTKLLERTPVVGTRSGVRQPFRYNWDFILF